MPFVVDHLTNRAYGYPQGSERRVTPIALACAHITANPNTAANPDLHEAARDERDYANRTGSGGPSAHYYVARDGWAIEAIDPDKYAAWSNGDLESPNTANPGIRSLVTFDEKWNPNEAYWLEFENVGASGYPITAAQKEFMAERIAQMSLAKDMPISRKTVHGHWEINGVDKVSCPSSGSGREAWLDDLVARAQAHRERLVLDAAEARIDALELEKAALVAQVGDLRTDVLALQNEITSLGAALLEAPAKERERIALAEAERIRGI